MISYLYKKHKSILTGVFWRSLQIFSKQGITFVVFLIIAKVLSPEDFGIYSYVLSIIFLLTTFSDFGISAATSKFIAEYKIQNPVKYNQVLFNSIFAVFVLSLAISGLFLILGPYLIDNTEFRLFLISLPLVFLVPATSVLDGVYRGNKYFRKLSLLSVIAGMISIPIIYVLVNQLSTEGALLGQMIFYLLIAIILGAFYSDYSMGISVEIIKEVSKYSLWIGLASMGYFLYTRVDMIILKEFNYVTEIGYYEIINRMFNFLLLPASIIGQVVAPDITKLQVSKNWNLLRKRFWQSNLLAFILGIFLTICFMIGFPWILSFFLPEYNSENMVSTYRILSLLAPLRFASIYLTQGFIVPSGFAKITTVITLVFGIANVVLDIIFIQILGFVGVFYASVIVQSLGTIATYIVYNYKVNLLGKDNVK